MKQHTRTQPFSRKFDFDIGYLVKSPCRGCERRGMFPACINDCPLLDHIHTVLAESVSCTRNL